MTTVPVAPDIDECIVAVDHRTGEAFVPLAYAAQLQARIAQLEALVRAASNQVTGD